MDWKLVLSLVGSGHFLVAILLVWNANLLCGRYDSENRRGLRATLMALAGVVAIAGLGMLLGAATESLVGVVVLLILLALFFGGIWMLSAFQLRKNRREALIWTLAAAADKGVPLHDAAQAFADENRGDSTARDLALLLQSGLPLPDAVYRSGMNLSIDARLAVSAGYRLDMLAECMGEVLHRGNTVDALIRESVERLLYFTVVLVATLIIASFLYLKIFPVINMMVAEFGLQPSPVLDWMVVAGPWLMTIAILLVLVFGFFGFVGSLYYIGLLPTELLGLGFLAKRLDTARLLRVLAASIRADKPLGVTLRILTVYFPRQAVRSRLYSAGGRVSEGEDWIVSLQQVNLLTAADAAVLTSAKTAGNLPWAMENLAELTSQRVAFRLRFWTSLAFPVIIALASVFFLLISASLFIPLADMIIALS